jgi:single-strand DNA-binding protein
MNTIQVTVAGNLTHDPELRFTSTGTAVASIRIAVTPRRPKGDGTFENGETTFLSGSVFGPTAEHVVASLKAGTRVIATGRLVERSFTATRGERQGETIRRHELVVDEIGVALRFATATVTKATGSAPDPEEAVA